jgi:hypothetical protein
MTEVEIAELMIDYKQAVDRSLKYEKALEEIGGLMTRDEVGIWFIWKDGAPSAERCHEIARTARWGK